MKASIIKIGNSKGIRIPKTFLEEIGEGVDIGDKVELSLKNKKLVVSPAKPTLPYNEEYLLSLSALQDWNSPEEDEAWAYLQ